MDTTQLFGKKAMLAFLISLTLIFVGFAAYLNHVLVQEESVQRVKTMNNLLATKVNELQQRLISSRERLRFLFDTPPIHGIVRALENDGYDAEDETDLKQWRERLTTIFRAFAAHNPDIDQIRYITAADGGKEFIRVERRSGNIRVVPDFELQQKGERDYYRATVKLGRHEIYVSDINLNQEHGHIELPHKPTYRVSMPVLNREGEVVAVLIINFSAQLLNADLARNLPENMAVFGIGEQGQFFYHPEPGRTFANAQRGDYQRAENQLTLIEERSAESGNNRYLDTVSKREIQLVMREIPIGFDGEVRSFKVGVFADPQAFAAMLERKSLSWNAVLLLIYLIMAMLVIVYSRFVQRRLQTAQTLSVYEAMFESANMPIVSVNTQLEISSWNPLAEELFGRNKRFAIGKRIDRMLPLEDKEQQSAFARLGEAAKDGHYGEMELKIKGPKGEPRVLVVNQSPVTFRGQSSVIGAVLIFNDVTRERALTRQVEEANLGLEKKVTERTQELEAAKEDAEQANRTKSLFIANISHELRTPMNGVFGMLNLIKKEPLSEQQRHYLKLAESSATTLTELINRVLDISKIEANKLELDIAQFDLESVACELIQSSAARAAEKGVELLLDTSGLQHKDILADVTRVKQILTNLVGNAIKFTEQGEVLVTLSSHLNGQRLEIRFSVADSGIGIDPAGIDRLFQPFTQADNSITRRFGGTGLGLSITRQLCRLMEGDVAVSSEPGKGSCFSGYFTVGLGAASSQPTDMSDTLMLTLLTEQEGKRGELIMRLFNSWHCPVRQVELTQLVATLASLETHYTRLVVLVDYTKYKKEAADILALLDGLPEASQIRLIFISRPLQRLVCPEPAHLELVHLPQPVTAIALRHAVLEETAESQSDGNAELPTAKPDYAEVRNMNVLVVDDNAINRVVVKGALKELPIALHFATQGEEALVMLRNNPDIDLVLMDCQMPIMDGYAATQAIRRGEGSDTHTQVPVLAMTASAMAGDRERCLQSGMSDYMTKPLDPELLIQKVLYWLKIRRVAKDQNADSVRSE